MQPEQKGIPLKDIIKCSSPVAMAFFLASALGAPAFANEGSTVLDSRINVTFVGVPVGTLNNTISLSGSQYSISGLVKSNRLVSIVAGAKVRFSSSGRISRSKLLPKAQNVNFKSSREKRNISLAFTSGNVRSASVSPKKIYKNGAVLLEAGHRRAVIDPVSALIIPVRRKDIGDGNKICDRTLPVFDGTARYNLKLSFLSSQKARTKGFSGEVFNCQVRYQPIAGHRPHKKNVKFLKANRSMKITFARIGNTSNYGLFAFHVKTRKGTAIGTAGKFAVR